MHSFTWISCIVLLSSLNAFVHAQYFGQPLNQNYGSPYSSYPPYPIIVQNDNCDGGNGYNSMLPILLLLLLDNRGGFGGCGGGCGCRRGGECGGGCGGSCGGGGNGNSNNGYNTVPIPIITTTSC
nr:uncharacterized protein LOC128669778 [Plodia interpunctella]